MEMMNLLDDAQSKTGNAGITGEMMDDLHDTAKWLRYLGLVGMSTCGILAILVFITLFAMSGINTSGMYPDGAIYGVMFFTLIFFGISGFMSFLVYRYGNNLKKYSIHRQHNLLEEAIENNKNLWLVLGVLTLTSIFIFMTISIFVGAEL